MWGHYHLKSIYLYFSWFINIWKSGVSESLEYHSIAVYFEPALFFHILRYHTLYSHALYSHDTLWFRSLTPRRVNINEWHVKTPACSMDMTPADRRATMSPVCASFFLVDVLMVLPPQHKAGDTNVRTRHQKHQERGLQHHPFDIRNKFNIFIITS